MHQAKRINRAARDRLVLELADRGIDFFKLPPDLFDHRIRDVLEWLKTHYRLTYCYRCQRLTEPEEMIGVNVCSRHDKNGGGPAYRMPAEVLELFRSKMDTHVVEDMQPPKPGMRDDVERMFKPKEQMSPQDILNRARGIK